MLTITIPSRELWDERNERFIYTKATTLQLEHSLVSLRKWEAKWHKPFLSDKDKSNEEIIDYIRCMTLTQNVDDLVYDYLGAENLSAINEYIKNPMTATTFSDDKSKGISNDIVTAEVLYWQMISLNIPVEFQKWHLNQLITLIRVCNIKNKPPKKVSQREAIANTAARNKARRPKKH